MSIALTNVDLLHRGWEDAVSEITPHLPEIRATMETKYAALVHDDRLDEEALLAAVRDVAAAAARAAGADKARLLSRALHRAVYEFLLSLDALTPEETDGEGGLDGVMLDPSRLIGVEEVAELEGRQSALRAEAEAAAAAQAAAEVAAAAAQAAAEQAAAERAAEQRAAAERAAAERAAAERAAAERAAAHRAAAERAAEERAANERAAVERAAQEQAAAQAAADRAAEERVAEERAAEERAAAYRASLGSGASVAEPGAGELPASGAELDPEDEQTGGGYYRPRFKIFRRGTSEEIAAGSSASEAPREDAPATPGAPAWWRGPEAPPAPTEPAVEPEAPVEVTEPAAAAPANEGGFAVAPRDGFHLTEFADFVRPAEKPEPARAAETPEAPSTNGDGGRARGWHIRSSHRPHTADAEEVETGLTGPELDEDAWEERRLVDSDPKIVEARGDINDLLRRRRCDEAASLLQKLAADNGNRSVAELALDAGDRCRALGKGNAALSCYIAASRADPSFEGPLMRLADVCLDDRDIDLAVTYLERVARLHRQRGDTRGALRLYRKIATIAPYRDDILATLMRANTTGQFED